MKIEINPEKSASDTLPSLATKTLPYYDNTMHDKHIYRGNTGSVHFWKRYMNIIHPAKRAPVKLPPVKKPVILHREVKVVTGPVRESKEVWVDDDMMDWTHVERIEERSCQTDFIIEKEKKVWLMPVHTGTEIAIQTEEEKHFDFDREVTPIVQILKARILEEAQFEAEQELEQEHLTRSIEKLEEQSRKNKETLKAFTENVAESLQGHRKRQRSALEYHHKMVDTQKKILARLASKKELVGLSETYFDLLSLSREDTIDKALISYHSTIERTIFTRIQKKDLAIDVTSSLIAVSHAQPKKVHEDRVTREKERLAELERQRILRLERLAEKRAQKLVAMKRAKRLERINAYRKVFSATERGAQWKILGGPAGIPGLQTGVCPLFQLPPMIIQQTLIEMEANPVQATSIINSLTDSLAKMSLKLFLLFNDNGALEEFKTQAEISEVDTDSLLTGLLKVPNGSELLAKAAALESGFGELIVKVGLERQWGFNVLERPKSEESEMTETPNEVEAPKITSGLVFILHSEAPKPDEEIVEPMIDTEEEFLELVERCHPNEDKEDKKDFLEIDMIREGLTINAVDIELSQMIINIMLNSAHWLEDKKIEEIKETLKHYMNDNLLNLFRQGRQSNPKYEPFSVRQKLPS